MDPERLSRSTDLRSCVTPVLVTLLLLAPQASLSGQDHEATIRSATSAGPASISADAAVLDWTLTGIRPGTNGWTCLPDRADTEGNDPWCVNEPWLDFLDAYVNQTEPTYDEIGFAYML